MMSSFDTINGTDTEGAVALEDLTIASPNASLGYPYQPTPEGVLTDAIHFLSLDPSRYHFVDLGCGKGRTLITASKLGFGSVEGVEFAAELATIARDNLSRLGLRNWNVQLGDAAEQQFSRENVVIYVFNSFAEPVLEAVLRNLVASPVQNFYLVYRNPSDPDVLHDCAGLSYVGSPVGRGGPGGVHVWTRRSAEADARSPARPPRLAFQLFDGRQLEPFETIWGETGSTPCDSLSVRVKYRRREPIVAHALVCAFDFGSRVEPSVLRRARLAQSRYFEAFDYLPEPKSEQDDVYVSELRVRFDEEVTVSRVALARWSNSGPITIVDCRVKLRAISAPT